jgi:hypothetical protein
MTEMLKDTTAVEDEQTYRTIALQEKTFDYNHEIHNFDALIKIKLPTLKQKETANVLYSKTYNRLLQDDDFLTTRQLLDQAKRRGQWSDKDEERLALIDNDIITKKEQVAEEKSKKKKEILETELASLRDEKFRLALRLGQITQTSIDNLAENERTEYMITNCIFSVDKDGKETPLYKNKEELHNERDLTKLERILLDARSFWSGEGLTDFLHLDV